MVQVLERIKRIDEDEPLDNFGEQVNVQEEEGGQVGRSKTKKSRNKKDVTV